MTRTQFGERFLTGGDSHGLDIAVTDQLDNRFSLGFIVLDNQQILHVSIKKSLDGCKTIREDVVG